MPKKHEEPENIISTELKRIGGYLHKIVPVLDETGKVISHTIAPVMMEFKPRDLMQVIVGASLLAVPVAFTEEVWNLSRDLPLKNIIALSATSLIFISAFVFFNFYRFNLKGYFFQFVKRVASIYIMSLLVCAFLLTLIDKCPWSTDWVLAMRRVIMVAFPASMSAAVTDTLK